MQINRTHMHVKPFDWATNSLVKLDQVLVLVIVTSITSRRTLLGDGPWYTDYM